MTNISLLIDLWCGYFGISNAELARKLGKTARTILNWKTGQKYDTAFVAKQLGLTEEEYLNGPENYSSPEQQGGRPVPPRDQIERYIVPGIMAPIYLFSKIQYPLDRSSFFGFSVPDNIILSDLDGVVIVLIDETVKGYEKGQKITVSTIKQPSPKDTVLVFDKQEDKAAFTNYPLDAGKLLLGTVL